MSALTDLIRIIPPDRDEDPEDIFASAPGLIFTDDLRNQHGDPDSTIIYKSKRFGEIELKTTDPGVERERQLFSHYLWNAGIRLAELISDDVSQGGKWSVKGEKVLELGAGVGLDGIIATLAGAAMVSISDYPSTAVLTNIRANAQRNIPKHHHHLTTSKYRIDGHEWGDFQTNFATIHAHQFTRILAADCYWMPGQHENLVRSMLHFLTLGSEGQVLVVAGFHTGRRKLAAFFHVAVELGLVVEEIYEEDADGVRREWVTERDEGREDPTERKKWLVIARLRRRQG
ncbi:hypothetical protein B0A50_01957 [Salinomyces thailandicus]|uniref:Nicotinamide N-methyltransferase n=1 Tax=Salinomyces thailandicus TaxID=706561 RepID=A0A4V5N5F3_9PEZI|nr:hypothetical protein B0A50_01957 [Salinomyces thailandica]